MSPTSVEDRSWRPCGDREILASIAPEAWASETELADWLTPAERRRLASFTAPARRRQYLGGHALLNRLLARLGSERTVGRAESGQPQATVDQRPVAVSLSHAGGLVAAAVGSVHRLGIDLEFPRNQRNWARLARRFTWLAHPESGERVFRWCLWEATGKARGASVFRGPDPVFEALRSGASEDWSLQRETLPGGGCFVMVCRS